MSRVVVVGSLNMDLVGYAQRLPGDGETVHGTRFARAAGGKGLNQAVAAARAGAETALVGLVGDDDLGALLTGEAAGAGVDVSAVTSVAGSSGVALIMVDARATNRIVVVPGANGVLDAGRVEQAVTALNPRVVLCQLETPLDGVTAALRLGRRCGAVTVLNPAPAVELPPELLVQVDWLVPNESEARQLSGWAGAAGEPLNRAEALRLADELRDCGPRGVVITLGERGAVAVGPDGARHHLDAFTVDAVDTTAAGDSFCGAFAAAVASGSSIEAALRRACATGALTTTRRGAAPSIPTAAEVDALLTGAPIGETPGGR
jgi:ribokinase